MGNGAIQPTDRTTASYLVTSQSMGDTRATVQAYSWGGVHALLEERRSRSLALMTGIDSDMTDLVLSNPDLVEDILAADRDARAGRFLSWQDVFGE